MFTHVHFIVALSCFTLASSTCGPFIKVITDLEDTLISPGYLHNMEYSLPAALDNQWSRNLPFDFTFYPGMVQFQIELSQGLTGANPTRPIVLTARSQLRGNLTGAEITKGRIAAEFHKAGGEEPELIMGSVSEKSFQNSVARANAFQHEKVQKQRAYQRRNIGQFQYILVGNNGQGDSQAARTMLADPKSCVKAAFLHDVMPASPVTSLGIHTYKTTADAAVQAVQNRLITPSGLRRVLNSIKASTEWKSCSNPCKCETCAKARVSQLVEGRPHASADALLLLAKQECWCVDCQADNSGFPTGCSTLENAVSFAEEFLVNITTACAPKSKHTYCPSNMWCRPICGNKEKGECVPFQREEESCVTQGVDECVQRKCNKHSICKFDGTSEIGQCLRPTEDNTPFKSKFHELMNQPKKYRKFNAAQTTGFVPGTSPAAVFVDNEWAVIRLFKEYFQPAKQQGRVEVILQNDDDDFDILDDDNGDDGNDDNNNDDDSGDDGGDDDGGDDNGDDDGGDDGGDDDGGDDESESESASASVSATVSASASGSGSSEDDDESDTETLLLVLGLSLGALCLGCLVAGALWAALKPRDDYGDFYLTERQKPGTGDTAGEGAGVKIDEMELAEAVTNNITGNEFSAVATEHIHVDGDADYSAAPGSYHSWHQYEVGAA